MLGASWKDKSLLYQRFNNLVGGHEVESEENSVDIKMSLKNTSE